MSDVDMVKVTLLVSSSPIANYRVLTRDCSLYNLHNLCPLYPYYRVKTFTPELFNHRVRLYSYSITN